MEGSMSDIFPRLQREAQSIDEGQEQHAFTLPFESIPEYTRQKSPVLKAQDEISGDEKEYQFVHSPVCRDAAVQIFGFLKKLSEAKPVKDKSEKQEQSASDELELSQAEVAVINEHVDSIFLILEFSNYLGLEEVISSIGTFLATKNLLEEREDFLKKLRLDNLKYDISAKLLMQLPKKINSVEEVERVAALLLEKTEKNNGRSCSPIFQWLSNNCQYVLPGGKWSGAHVYVYNVKKGKRKRCNKKNTGYLGDHRVAIGSEYRGSEFDLDSTILSASSDNRVWIYTNCGDGNCIDLPAHHFCGVAHRAILDSESKSSTGDMLMRSIGCLGCIDGANKCIQIYSERNHLKKCYEKLSFYIWDRANNSLVLLKPHSVDTEQKLLSFRQHTRYYRRATKMMNDNQFVLVDYSTRQVAHIKYSVDTFEIVGIRNILQNSEYKQILSIDTPSTPSIMAFVKNKKSKKIYLYVYDVNTEREDMIWLDSKYREIQLINWFIRKKNHLFYKEGSLFCWSDILAGSDFYSGYFGRDFIRITLNPNYLLINNDENLTYKDELIVYQLLKNESKHCNLLSRTYYSFFSTLSQAIQKRLVEYLGFIPPIIDHDNTSIQYSRIKKGIADQFNDMRRKKSVSAETANLLLKKIVERARLRKQYVPFCKSDFNSEKEYLWPNAQLSNRSVKGDLINNRITL